MDNQLLGQVASSLLLLMRIGSDTIKARFPDTRRMRLVAAAVTSVNTLSYALQKSWTAAAVQGGACLRSTILSTKWGASHPKLVGFFTTAASLSVSIPAYRDPVDIMPIAGTMIGAAVDLQSQGRYTRLSYALLYPVIWLPVRLHLNDKPGMAADIYQTISFLVATYKHDIENAAGGGQGFRKDLKAYLHGVFKNSATGAKIEGQVSTHAGHKDVRKQYLEKLQKQKNPYFLDQQKAINGATAQLSI